MSKSKFIIRGSVVLIGGESFLEVHSAKGFLYFSLHKSGAPSQTCRKRHTRPEGAMVMLSYIYRNSYVSAYDARLNNRPFKGEVSYEK